MKRAVNPTNPDATVPDRIKERLSPGDSSGTTNYILGGGPVAIAIAQDLQSMGHGVVVVDDSYQSPDIPVFTGDPAATEILAESGVDDESRVIVASYSDHRNLLIAQLVRTRFDVRDIVVFVHDPARAPLFADAGHEPFCVTSAVASGFGETI